MSGNASFKNGDGAVGVLSWKCRRNFPVVIKLKLFLTGLVLTSPLRAAFPDLSKQEKNRSFVHWHSVRSPEVFLSPDTIHITYMLFQTFRKVFLHRKLFPDKGWNNASQWEQDSWDGRAVLVIHGPDLPQTLLMAKQRFVATHCWSENQRIKESQRGLAWKGSQSPSNTTIPGSWASPHPRVFLAQSPSSLALDTSGMRSPHPLSTKCNLKQRQRCLLMSVTCLGLHFWHQMGTTTFLGTETKAETSTAEAPLVDCDCSFLADLGSVKPESLWAPDRSPLTQRPLKIIW